MTEITLGKRTFPIDAVPLGKLKIITPAVVRAGRAFERGEVSEGAMNDVIAIIAAGTGLSVEDIESIPGATMPQLSAAMRAISVVSGLIESVDAGNAESRPEVATPSTGTTSTPG
ncbi:MAG: hypothetical protein REI09_05225 [Candidatus Dactylopiibacterium sp.]|nr:hypothetical protein [Candidatus Dactylopiibacterium sp.]